MTWFKVDDSFYDHPKAFDASDAAVALWLRAGTWSARNLTDGFVPDGMLARLSERATEAAAELVRRGLWKRARGGHRFHDWGDYNPTAETVREQRAKRAEAGRLGGLASGKTRRRRTNEAPTKDQRSDDEGRSSDPRNASRNGHEGSPGRTPAREDTRSKREANAEANAKHAVGESLNPRPGPAPSFSEGRKGPAGAASRGAAPPAPAPAAHPSSSTDPENPDWRTLPAYGQAEPRAESPARAAARAAATRTRRREPDGPSAFEQLRQLTDPTRED